MLGEAQHALQQLVAQRLKEFMLLTDLPLVCKPRTQLQLDRIYSQGDYQHSWQVTGSRCSMAHVWPNVPAGVKLHVYSAMDVLLGLATHHHVPKGASDSTNASPRSKMQPAQPHPQLAGSVSRPLHIGHLPRSLALLEGLPALQGLTGPCLEWLRLFCSDLRPQQRHVGVDDRLLPWFRQVKLQAGSMLLEEGSMQMCQNFARFGVPNGLRAAVWETALGLGEAGNADADSFEALSRMVLEQPLLIDISTCSDVMALAGDSEHFFLFEETLRAVMLAFSRDAEVLQLASAQGPTVSLAAASSRLQPSVAAPGNLSANPAAQAGSGGLYPPSGVVPCHGLILLAAPLCYLHQEPYAVYRLFKSMFCRYWCKLFSLSNTALPSPSLPGLCATYQDLLKKLEPGVVEHMRSLGLHPISLAMPWLLSGFVGYLAVEEVLLLWDRIVGLDSLLPLAIMAVAVVCFRRQVLLASESVSEVMAALSDLSQLQCVPLLQAVLFQG